MDSPGARVKIAIAESERLKDYLSSLSPEDWSKPSACNRWQVLDVVAHLAWVAETYTERTRQSLQEDPSTTDGQPAPGPVTAAAFADGNAQRAISRREKLGEQVLTDFIKTNDQLLHLLANVEPQDWERPHYYSSLGTEPLRYRPDLWSSELAMHGWDIRSRLDAQAPLSEECLPVLMDVIPGQVTRFIFSPGRRLARPIRYRWELAGPGARNSDVVVEGDKASFEPAGTGKADVTLHCDTETFALIAFTRLTVDAATSAGRLTIEGDIRLANDFQRWFPRM